MRTPFNHQPNGRSRVATAAAMFAVVAAAVTAGAALADQDPSTPTVVGTGPRAVFVGPAPSVGGDPARGETEESYFARTGRHLPGRPSVVSVDGPWWYGPAPTFGGDPASGETEDSYFARTGRHLPVSRTGPSEPTHSGR